MSVNAETSVTIQAPIEKVWQRLSQLESYASWNARTRFHQQPKLGQTQKMRVKLFGLWLSVPVKIQSFNFSDGIRWQGGIPGLYTGSHYFRLQAGKNDTTTLIQGEDFEGVLVPALWPVIKKELQSLYEGMNQDLKSVCESTRSV